MLSISNFNKKYNGRLIISVDEWRITPGIHWIKGDNGSGKSTLFKSIAGLIPFEGTIAFDNGVNAKVHPVAYRKRINYGEAEPQYPGFLTANQIIHFIASAKGTSTEQRNYYVNAFAMEHYIHTPIHTYSTGMLKKLSLVNAFLGSADVIILDEPFIGLDNDARIKLATLIHERLAQTQTPCFLISSHQALEDADITPNYQYIIRDETLQNL